MDLAKHKLKKYTHLYDRISEIYHFTEFDFKDIKQITEELSEVEITDCAIKVILSKATRFRQIVQIIDKFEQAAQANSLTQIDENVAKEILG